MKKAILTMSLGLLSCNVLAAAPAWDYAQLSIIKADYDSAVELKPIGGMVFVSNELSEHMFIAGSYSYLRDEVYGTDVEVSQSTLGVGYKYSVTANTDVFSAITFEYGDNTVKAPGYSQYDDGSGYGVMAGVRSLITSQIELKAALRFVDIDGEDETSLGLAADYLITPRFAVGVNYDNGSAFSLVGINLRYNY
ncbi:outer membrane beta-barrel protein [Salinimonas sediminis]|uniref:Porin family protein n=1 Tax=Salinimonas sediminis TaxID=2303538 RepID=A0A346NHR6_9ALTE|nr:outer membrane beta-barrel protein [Salinimonas sediminis]AXR05073.1 porin family protein [Salinimonas sediminis]